jgi:glycosyltransferase involved in cell wall biosynthesis
VPRTVIVAHGHPSAHAGGGEVAAHRQFRYMRSIGEDVYFIGMVQSQRAARYFTSGAQLVAVGAKDYMRQIPSMDPYEMDFADPNDESELVRTLIELDAQVYHFHHIWNVGIRTIQRLMRALPNAKYVITLHEYMMICANNGQMVKAGAGHILCNRGGPYECLTCLPARSPGSIFLRQLRLSRLLSQFDLIIAPSHFLRERHEQWDKINVRIRVLENGIGTFDELEEAVATRSASLEHNTTRFAFFGQLTPMKGVDVLVSAALELARRGNSRASIDIYGMSQEQFLRIFPNIRPSGPNIQFMGRYAPQEVVSKMKGYGWIIVPSIWWENSPVVIQEARLAKTPVIASNIGGMREKISTWGALFEVGNAIALADKIEQLCGNIQKYNQMKASMQDPMMLETFHRLWSRWVLNIEKGTGRVGQFRGRPGHNLTAGPSAIASS